MESYRSFKYNKTKPAKHNPELDRPLDQWYEDKKMLVEDLSQGMAERKRFSQELMQARSNGAKRDMEFLFDNQPYDPRDTFKGELARRPMMYGEIPFG